MSRLALGFLTAPARRGLAQAPRRASPGLNEFALEWTRGEYRAPLICEIDGVPYRALRRILVSPGPRQHATSHEPARPLRSGGTRGHPLPRRDGWRAAERDREPRSGPRGALPTRHGRAATSTGAPQGGRLRIPDPHRAAADRGAGEPASALREVDFSGGTAIRKVERGSDAFRRLADFGQRRKLSLVLEAPDGTRLSFDLVQFGLR